jgi:hypothetical protein
MVGGGFWLGTPNLKDLRNLIYDYLAEGIKNDNLKMPFLEMPLYHASLYIVFAAAALRKWWKNIKSTIFLLFWFLGPITMTWFVSQHFQSIFFNRYLLYTIPGAILILVSSRSKLSIIPLSILAVFFGIVDYQYFTNPAKLPFRQYSEYVKSELQEDDFLINWYSNGTHHIWETKYYGIPAPIYAPGEGDLPFFVGTALMEEGDIIREIPKETEKVGVITSGPIEEVSVPGYTESKVKEFDRLKFIRLTKND